MLASGDLRFRAACPGDAHAITALHAGSWQRHYRGAFSDAFLDSDITGYLLPLWTERLARPDPRARTILAEIDGAVAGLAHTLLGEHPAWGAFLDNLHVAHGLKRQGIGTRLLALTGQEVADRSPGPACTCGCLSRTAPPAPSTRHRAAPAWSAPKSRRQAETRPGSTASRPA